MQWFLSGLLLLSGGLPCAMVAANAQSATSAKSESSSQTPSNDRSPIFDRRNLVAWCIVPFDSEKRGPEARAAMLQKLGFSRFAYDYRAEHIPTFDQEIEALKKHGVELTAWWFPGTLNDEAKMTLAIFKKHGVTPQLWVTGGGDPTKDSAEQRARVVAEAARIRPIALAAAEIGCQVGLYNHGGWFGEPENQIEVIEELKLPNVGIVYNQHHGHDHVDRFSELLQKMKPHLIALNLNGMEPGGDRRGQKIVQLGNGSLDLELLKIVRESGYTGLIGILGHTQDDAEKRLQDNLDGLDWLLPQLNGQKPGPKPKYRTETPTPVSVTPKAERIELQPGRFGNALNAAAGGVFVNAKPVLRNLPLTVECWTKLNNREGFNILIASEPKASATHWEMYSYAGSGVFSVYLPGRGGEYRSDVSIVDQSWHHVAMVLESGRLRLFVDGKSSLDKSLPEQTQVPAAGVLAVGQLVEGGIGCAGLIDEVRIRSAAIPVESLPATAFASDRQTTGLWRFDESDGKTVRDESSSNIPATAEQVNQPASAAIPPAKPKVPAHWGRGEVGFEGWEDDWVDRRWQQAEIGEWLGTVVSLPQGPYRKSLNIRVGDQRQGTISFDTQFLSLRAAWNGFLVFDPARFGIIGAPKPEGDVLFTMPEVAGWSGTKLQYEGMHVRGPRVLLSYSVDGVKIQESPWLHVTSAGPVFTRTIQVEPSAVPLTCLLQDLPDTALDGQLTIQVSGTHQPVKFVQNENGRKRVLLKLAASETTQTAQIVYSSATSDALVNAEFRLPPAERLEDLPRPAERRWKETLVTTGKLGEDSGPYVVDTLTLPLDNPWNALLFTSGHDFLSNGDVLVCTVHGDVWRVSETDADGTREDRPGRAGTLNLSWQRIATGLHQPLGLVVKRGGDTDQVYVLGRDQITRLHDQNGDGETDFYECFSNVYETSAGGHDYITCLEQDSEGGFWFVHATHGVVRVSPDGQSMKVVATGLRNPNGMGMGPAPGNVVTAAPQEGEWTPASAIYVTKPGAHFGGGGPRITETRPLGYDPPLVWIPRRVDNSSGGQVWVSSDRWGPLKGQMLHLSFGQCSAMLVGMESSLQKSELPNAAFVSEFPFRFDSGAMRGRFSPHDGQLYVTGLRGWTSAATVDGCLQRVRYTGKAVDIPVGIRTYRNGISLTFAEPLQKEAAELPGNYHLEEWNYRYSKNYGSPEFRVSDARQEGRDTVRVRSATLLDDRTVFLELKDVHPVHVMAVSYVLKSGTPESSPREFRQTLYATIHRAGSESIDEKRIVRHRDAGSLNEENADDLQPGLIARISSNGISDARIDRMAAIFVPQGKPVTPFFDAGSVRIRWEGFLQVPLQQTVRFHAQGSGSVALSLNGSPVASDVLLKSEAVKIGEPVRLNGGLNQLVFEYSGPENSHASVRLLWESPEFALEPVPPTALFCPKDDESVLTAAQLRRGRELFSLLRCEACHGQSYQQDGTTTVAATSEDTDKQLSMELIRGVPNLAGSSRLQQDWLVDWIRNPQQHSESRMPRMNVSKDEANAIVAWLRERAPHELAEDASSGAKEAELPAEVIAAGSDAYEDLGCAGCHHLRSDESDAYQRRSLNHVGRKFRSGQLAAFLREPHRFYHASRMPDFQLDVPVSSTLAASVLKATANGSDNSENGEKARSFKQQPDAELVARGEKLFGERGCIRCHAIGPQPSRVHDTPIALMDAASPLGCLALEPHVRAGVPHYSLSPKDRAALTRFLATDRRSLHSTGTSEAAQLLSKSLRCSACHDRDQSRSPRAVIISEEGQRGLVPEALPNLTWTGEKLNSDWMQQFIGRPARIAGTGSSLRPWLKARMPAFPAYAAVLAEGLAAEHGLAPEAAGSFSVDAHLAELGNQLTQRTALDCRQCHAVGSQPAQGDDQTKIAPGINFAIIGDRLRQDYYQRFTLDPPRFDINSRMPKLSADGKTTKVTGVLNGDAKQQFNAVWHFIHQGRQASE
jgi:mono/diheme cytochrome c family protein/cytochrome c-type biogenesis protein CcmH/NrfF